MSIYIDQNQFHVLIRQKFSNDEKKKDLILFVGDIFFNCLSKVECYTTNDQNHIRFAINKPTTPNGKNYTHFFIFNIKDGKLEIHVFLTDSDYKILPSNITNPRFLEPQKHTKFKIINPENVANIEIYQIVGLAILAYNSRQKTKNT